MTLLLSTIFQQFFFSLRKRKEITGISPGLHRAQTMCQIRECHICYNGALVQNADLQVARGLGNFCT